MKYFFLLLCLLVTGFTPMQESGSWIRVNLLGYRSTGLKTAVWVGKSNDILGQFQLVDVITGKVVYQASAGKPLGAYGPFIQTYRLDFSPFTGTGKFILQVGSTSSPEFTISEAVYKGAADFCLRYLRQQRSGFNPFLKDSCHTHDGYSLYGASAGLKDSTHVDVSGGWHDASDYLQYSTTSANATYHLLMAWRDYPGEFGDGHQANGLEGANGTSDVLDEARWGLQWLLKMHPRPEWLFNQLGDDRDHAGMRIPKQDSFYGKGYERPVYFVSGEPQQRGKFMNISTGTASIAAKFASSFSLGASLLESRDQAYAQQLKDHAISTLAFANKKPGFSQTASVLSPYIYTETNWVDDMELAYAAMNKHVPSTQHFLEQALDYARKEPNTPWLGRDTARHYEWYPFVNVGHYELAKQLSGRKRQEVIQFMRSGIQKVWELAKQNAFYRGIPFIWCSNNLTVAFAIQCLWYRELSGDTTYAPLEQACFDWVLGCNIWGTSMVYGLPADADTPIDPHSAFTHLGKYPIDGGLVDGPVYTTIYNSLIGITLFEPDEYAPFQSKLAVYHDDYGDYSTNEPTMDGTATLVYLLAAKSGESWKNSRRNLSPGNEKFLYDHGGIVRGDSAKKHLALIFTGDSFADGGDFIVDVLKKVGVKASFFFTGNFYENLAFQSLIRRLAAEGHYLGPHSHRHLLYCDWNQQDSLLVTKEHFQQDFNDNLMVMQPFLKQPGMPIYFIPPYEWYNDSITQWTNELGHVLFNFTPGLITHTDYTTPQMPNYRNSDTIYRQLLKVESTQTSGLNGFIILVHIGTDPARTDKFYRRLPTLLPYLLNKGYQFLKVDELLNQ